MDFSPSTAIFAKARFGKRKFFLRHPVCGPEINFFCQDAHHPADLEPPVGEKDDWEMAVAVEVGGLRRVIVRVSRQEGTMLVDGRVRYRLDLL